MTFNNHQISKHINLYIYVEKDLNFVYVVIGKFTIYILKLKFMKLRPSNSTILQNSISMTGFL